MLKFPTVIKNKPKCMFTKEIIYYMKDTFPVTSYNTIFEMLQPISLKLLATYGLLI